MPNARQVRFATWAVVLASGVLAGLLLMIFVVPKWEAASLDFAAQLTGFERGLYSCSHLVRRGGLPVLFLAFLALLAALAWRMLAVRSERDRRRQGFPVSDS
jgi:type II secretory pathway component PulF